MSDHYRTIAAPAESRIKIERSDFVGIAFPVETEDAFFAELQRIGKRHFDATHHCWAFRLFGARRPPAGRSRRRPGGPSTALRTSTGETPVYPVAETAARLQRSSDAGEPSGTAGKPILSAIEGADLWDLGVVVVRWYGGIKLGTGGLSRAYRESAAETLRAATPVDRYVYERLRVEVPFDSLGTIYRLVDPPNVILAEEQYGERNVFEFDVRASRVEDLKTKLTERRLLILP